MGQPLLGKGVEPWEGTWHSEADRGARGRDVLPAPARQTQLRAIGDGLAAAQAAQSSAQKSCNSSGPIAFLQK